MAACVCCIDELSSVKGVTMSFEGSTPSLSLFLFWDEPFPENLPNVVDYYLVEVNSQLFNTTLPEANVTVMTTEPINITITSINCVGSSPTAKLILHLPEG